MKVDIEVLKDFLESKGIDFELIVHGESIELVDHDEGLTWLLTAE